MDNKQFKRRDFLKSALLVSGGILLSPVITACRNLDDFAGLEPAPQGLQIRNFDYGVASFDPTESSVIIWTRYNSSSELCWEISKSADFSKLESVGRVVVEAMHDNCISIEIKNLPSNSKYYYRFYNRATKDVSVVGETITLPSKTDAANSVKMAVASCSNYPAGHFNVYKEMANSDADVIIHLGDYIYEYAPGQYGSSAFTAAAGRNSKPEKELITLEDYRTRYKQYRSDKNLQLAHQKKPFICVWDDHEIANDTYMTGAENHQTNEGSFETRKANAIQAYSEFIPVKTGDNAKIFRSFDFGNILSLHMMDTRVIARSKQLEYSNYFTATGFNAAGFQKDYMDGSRTLLGSEQISWLSSQVKKSTAKWQVLEQQVLMAKMLIPAEMLMLMAKITAEAEQLGTASTASMLAFQKVLQEMIVLKTRFLQKDPTLTAEEKARITTVLPYNLDAWDGYPVEREKMYASLGGKSIVALAGDTHNGWYSELYDATGKKVGVELAASSVTSPGMEKYIGISNATQAAQLAGAFALLIDELQYVNLYQRGYLYVNFTASNLKSEWRYVDTVFSESYAVTTEKTVTI